MSYFDLLKLIWQKQDSPVVNQFQYSDLLPDYILILPAYSNNPEKVYKIL